MQEKKQWDFGDVKLIATLGLFFGTALTISIAIISFIIAGVISAITIIYRKRKNIKSDEYISFGPCIIMATIICIIFPEKSIVSALLTIFTLGRVRV